MQKPMTDKEYVAAGGCRCPVCRSDNVVGESIGIEGRDAVQEVRCSDCGACWNDVYSLQGYDNLERGDQ